MAAINTSKAITEHSEERHGSHSGSSDPEKTSAAVYRDTVNGDDDKVTMKTWAVVTVRCPPPRNPFFC